MNRFERRLHELEQSMAAVEARSLVNVDNRIRQTTLSGSDSVQAMQLHVKTPLGPAPRMLARDLNFNVAPGERLLIVGRSGTCLLPKPLTTNHQPSSPAEHRFIVGRGGMLPQP
jgi:ABC-type transport system involved in cytochrome bd biosynthesis fused ATPase/permease subunit